MTDIEKATAIIADLEARRTAHIAKGEKLSRTTWSRLPPSFSTGSNPSQCS
jgi:hypothetical protein